MQILVKLKEQPKKQKKSIDFLIEINEKSKRARIIKADQSNKSLNRFNYIFKSFNSKEKRADAD
jgi:hypothetical protein